MRIASDMTEVEQKATNQSDKSDKTNDSNAKNSANNDPSDSHDNRVRAGTFSEYQSFRCDEGKQPLPLNVDFFECVFLYRVVAIFLMFFVQKKTMCLCCGDTRRRPNRPSTPKAQVFTFTDVFPTIHTRVFNVLSIANNCCYTYHSLPFSMPFNALLIVVNRLLTRVH